ncbi:hypothetical protein MTZ49_03560 [Entomomonas sp. E2T0]|uniref:hypothetical protein n=1 Tax=Entomomonas sp. E2T0 TaxID=2930213 RepID=UPI0022281C56|nr:hypothetical protein [Entomomonas sp. E2T0]UYZ84654.1 hypothetical protein MTZ49_03560 [Entomomonas sp. E2T0]
MTTLLRKEPLVLAIMIILLFTTYAMANMRAAMRNWQPPSSVLKAPQVDSANMENNSLPNLEVLQETLKINCDHYQCQVNAAYHVNTKEKEALKFEFILPIDTKVTATINTVAVTTNVTMDNTYRFQEDEISSMSRFENSFQVYKADFSGTLQKGDNIIEVNYIQPLSILEADYGYFISSRFVENFIYILAPLKEWKLADNFVLNVEVSTVKKRPDRNPWSLFKSRAINCSLTNGKTTKENGKVVYRNKLTKEFPNNLICTMGDSDLLKGL